MSYDLGGGYDAWKTATPWDDEKTFYVSFDCSECEHFNDGVEAVGSTSNSEVNACCEDCDAVTCVYVGDYDE